MLLLYTPFLLPVITKFWKIQLLFSVGVISCRHHQSPWEIYLASAEGRGSSITKSPPEDFFSHDQILTFTWVSWLNYQYFVGVVCLNFPFLEYHHLKPRVQLLFSPQAPCGVIEDIRVYVVVGAVVWPAGEWYHNVLSQGRQCCNYKFPFQLIGGRQVPQQAFIL